MKNSGGTLMVLGVCVAIFHTPIGGVMVLIGLGMILMGNS